MFEFPVACFIFHCITLVLRFIPVQSVCYWQLWHWFQWCGCFTSHKFIHVPMGEATNGWGGNALAVVGKGVLVGVCRRNSIFTFQLQQKMERARSRRRGAIINDCGGWCLKNGQQCTVGYQEKKLGLTLSRFWWPWFWIDFVHEWLILCKLDYLTFGQWFCQCYFCATWLICRKGSITRSICWATFFRIFYWSLNNRWRQRQNATVNM